MVVIWTKEITSRGTVKAIQVGFNDVHKSCIECGEYREIIEFKRNPNINSHLFLENLEDECLDCMVKKKEFPPLPKKNNNQEMIISGYHNFKKLFIENKKRKEYEVWEFKVEPKKYILFIKDKENEMFSNHLFANMQGKDSSKRAAYLYFTEKYGADFFSSLKNITICSYSISRKHPLVRRNHTPSEFLKFVPEEHQVNLQTIENDLKALDIENTPERYQAILEGKIVQYYGDKYERSPLNRQRALELHGFTCKVCGFNFEEVYGERGKDFIEIHHVKPLYSLKGEEQPVDPRTDLVPVCSNCHRMIHRRPGNILKITELQSILKNKSKLT